MILSVKTPNLLFVFFVFSKFVIVMQICDDFPFSLSLCQLRPLAEAAGG
jgi:hypothetical protein